MFNYLRAIFKVICLTSLIAIFSGFLYAQVPEDTRCAECGMKVDAKSKFISYGLSDEGKKIFFCDVGDMLSSLKRKRFKIKEIYVKDYNTGEWIDGQKAYYVHSKKFSTPMGWGLAAFRDISEAKSFGNPVEFNNALNLLK